MEITITQTDAFDLGLWLYKFGINASFYRLVGTYEIKRQGNGITLQPVVKNPQEERSNNGKY